MTCATPAAAQWTGIAPGVELLKRTDPGPRRVRALRVDLCAAGVKIRATTSSERGKRTSSWATGAGVIAAVNGGFFKSGFAPDQGVAIGVGQAWPESNDTGVRGYIGFGFQKLAHSPAGDVTQPPTWMEEAVNGDATLVSGGTAVNCGGCGGGRNPRTAAGYTADKRTLYLVTVDGRSSSSIGMTIDELAVLMASFGVDRAMNLDGGGSTTMWVNGQGVVNVPSDGSERVVGNHLGVFATGSGSAHNCYRTYGSEYVGSGFPGGSTTITVAAGTTGSGWLEFKNIGTETWTANTRLAPTPRDQPSPVAASSWIAPHRIGGPDANTAPGTNGRFSFDVTAPSTPGTYKQTLSIVEEGVTWFADSLGPPDATYSFTVVATDGPPGAGGASSGGAGSAGSGGVTGVGGLGGAPSSGAGGQVGAGGSDPGWGDAGQVTGGQSSTGGKSTSGNNTRELEDTGCGCRAIAARPKNAWWVDLLGIKGAR